MRFIYYLLLIITTTSVFGQESFLEHKTDKGETAYSVALKYNIALHELYKFNNDIKEGVRKGQTLKIPIYTKIAEIPAKNTDTNASTQTVNPVIKTYTHTVVSGETLYSLAKKYNVTAKSIEAENQETLKDGLKIGQDLIFLSPPVVNNADTSAKTANYTYDDKDAVVHTVLPQETLYSIARTYNVSVEDIIDKNEVTLKDGLQVGQQIKVPNRKKTVDGRVRVINKNTIFHTVLPFETKYSISRLYGITIDQLEIQNPEIISVLKVGNELAINKEQIKPENANEELMLVLAEKQVVVEKAKIKETQIQNLQDRLKAQEMMNQKIVTISKLNFDLNLIDVKSTDVKSSEKLKLVLEANSKVQEILRVKLDSLILYMNNDLESLKTMPTKNIEEVKKLEKASLDNIAKTNEMSNKLKVELAENRKTYTNLMSKIERIYSKENEEYKKKIKEGTASKSKIPAAVVAFEEVKSYQNSYEENDIVNELLIGNLVDVNQKKKEVVKKQISEASFYGKQSRSLDDKLALTRLAKYKAEAIEKRKKKNIKEEVITPMSLQKALEFMTKNPTFYKSEIATMKEIKNLKDVNDGYYIVANNFTEAEPRDAFIQVLLDSGEFGAGFFFNVNTLSYVVYLDQYNTFDGFISALKQKEKNPYYKKIKILRLQYQESK